jgi:hypothetical protein
MVNASPKSSLLAPVKNICQLHPHYKYRISANSFRGKYSFLKVEIQRSQYIRPKVTLHKCAETIQGRKLFKGGNYSRKYGKLISILVTEDSPGRIHSIPNHEVHVLIYSNYLISIL